MRQNDEVPATDAASESQDGAMKPGYSPDKKTRYASIQRYGRCSAGYHRKGHLHDDTQCVADPFINADHQLTQAIMPLSVSTSTLERFLLTAKQATYAAQGDDASVVPLLPDSKQLEYREGPFFYRDIYVGMLRFVGQETVYLDDHAIWSMSYAGGLQANSKAITASQIYTFLRRALQNAPPGLPLRGPHSLTSDALHYTCQCTGSIEQFHGIENISLGGECLYQLHFSGGTLA